MIGNVLRVSVVSITGGPMWLATWLGCGDPTERRVGDAIDDRTAGIQFGAAAAHPPSMRQRLPPPEGGTIALSEDLPSRSHVVYELPPTVTAKQVLDDYAARLAADGLSVARSPEGLSGSDRTTTWNVLVSTYPDVVLVALTRLPARTGSGTDGPP